MSLTDLEGSDQGDPRCNTTGAVIDYRPIIAIVSCQELGLTVDEYIDVHISQPIWELDSFCQCLAACSAETFHLTKRT